MKSFDYFDTLVTRLVAKPTDLFVLVGERCGLPDFERGRVAAELQARRQQPGLEVTLAQIYEYLPYPPADRQRALRAELALEDALAAPIRANLERLRDGDIVVSDIYLRPAALRGPLERLLGRRAPRLVVSSEAGLRKADGGLWKQLVAAGTRPSLHVGDNLVSDVLQPRRLGIRTEHYTRATLNRHERLLDDGTVDGSIVAGCARAARLRAPGSWPAERHALAEVFASTVAPALTAFIDHVLDECERRAIGRIRFLARDGQLLHRIAELRASQRSAAIDLRYVYGSRQALHLPGYTDIAAAQSWLLEDTPRLALGDIAARAGIAVAELVTIGARHGLGQDTERSLSRTERERLSGLVRDPAFEHALQDSSRARWATADAYYRAAGFGPGRDVALVDVGWNGRMQSSLRALLDKSAAPAAAIHGFYFCLSRRPATSGADTLEGFAHDPLRDRDPNLFDGYRAMVEAFLEADHGTTLGFEDSGQGVEPVLAEPPAAAALQAVAAQQDTVLAFVAALAQAERAIGRRVRIDKGRALAVLGELLQRPTAAEAGAFHARERSEGQVETHTEALVRRLGSARDLLHRERLGFWPEGSASLSGMRWALPPLAIARRVRGAGRPA